MTKKGKTTKFSFVLVAVVFTVLCMMSTVLTACGGTVSVSLDKTEATLFEGDTLKLTPTITGKDNAEIEWTTDNADVATVRRGTVSAKGKGSAVITAKIEDTDVTATCNVTVKERTVTISATTATINLEENNTFTLTATASDGGEVTWNSSNPAVATVNKGVVTGLDVGTATITAQRGTATATCEVSVIEPNRPADYYKMTKMSNLECIDDAGTWHWHADGSMGGSFGFEKEPLHRDGTASVTLSPIPDVNNLQYFYFRYQPKFVIDSESTDEPAEIAIGDYYTMTLELTVSENCTLRLGSRRKDTTLMAFTEVNVKAGETTEFEYIGCRNEAEPFSIRINTPVAADKVSISAKLKSLTPHDGTNLPDYQTKVEEKPVINYEEIEQDASEYEMVMKSAAEVIEAPSKWHYNQGSGSMILEAKYNNGTATLQFDTIVTTGDNQFRYRPNVADKTKIKLEFNILSTADMNAVVCATATDFKIHDWNSKSLVAGQEQSFVVEMTLAANEIITIIPKPKADASNVTVTVSNIKIYKEVKSENPPVTGESYDLALWGKADVLANPGKWGYNRDGASVVEGTPSFSDGTISINFSSVEPTGDTNKKFITLRFRPDMPSGTNYKISFTLTASQPVDVACFLTVANSGYQKGNVTEANGSVSITGNYTAVDDDFIQIRIGNAFTENMPLNITVSNIVITTVA